MKLFLNTFLCCFLTALIVASCNFKEEMTIQPDGSGKISIDFDGSALMDMAGDEMAKSGEEQKMDSIIDFAHFLEDKKDSISQLPQEDQDKLKRLEKFKMRILMDTEAKDMKFSMFTEFIDVNELSDMMSSFQDASAAQKLGNNTMSKAGPSKGGSTEGTDVAYSFVDNRFSRITTIVNQELFQKSIDSLEQMKMFLGESTYTLNYNFPKKIKNISAKKALFSQDGKSFTLEVSFLEMMENPKILDVEVELEN